MMASIKLILQVALILCVLNSAFSAQILTSPLVNNWGDWGEWERCPAGTFVTGFQLQVQGWQGPLDDTALNSIRLFCGRRGDGVTSESITSAVGVFGNWKTSYPCNGEGYAIGFTLRSLENDPLDQAAAQNLRLLCSGSTTGFIEGDGEGWGEWTTPRICNNNEYICGIRTQVQPDQGIFVDDTALNNLSVECCNL